jgi:hypothetical protein
MSLADHAAYWGHGLYSRKRRRWVQAHGLLEVSDHFRRWLPMLVSPQLQLRTIRTLLNCQSGRLWSCVPALRYLHEYLENANFQTATSMTDGTYQNAHKMDLNFFAHLQSNPQNGAIRPPYGRIPARAS